MRVYLDLVLLLNTAVDFLLLLAANRICGVPRQYGRCLGAAALGGVYACACLLPGFRFLGGILWRLLSLVGMALLAFGKSLSSLRRSLLFLLLTMALGGLATALGSGGFWNLLLSCGGLALLCAVGFRARPGSRRFVPVRLEYGGRREDLLALLDTGNELRDPVTGQNVLVIGAEPARRLLGLTAEQLSDPVGTLSGGAYPGLRLIPFSTVGQSRGFLLALRIPTAQIDGKIRNTLVAFSPALLDREGTYQAILGGEL